MENVLKAGAGSAMIEFPEEISACCGVASENIWVHVTHAITTPHIPHDLDEAPKDPGPGGPGGGMSPEEAVKKRALYLAALTSAGSSGRPAAMKAHRPSAASARTSLRWRMWRSSR